VPAAQPSRTGSLADGPEVEVIVGAGLAEALPRQWA
jgi:hypothetical protein